jgi:calcineurin-like phosphoesterase family protein
MVVGKKDIIYHVGDVAFGRLSLQLVSLLNGSKRLILGNHDTYPTNLYLQYFQKLYGVLFWERCIISHIPVHARSLGARWMLNIHGHLHSRRVKRNIYDIMEMQTDQGPVQFSKFHHEEEDPNYLNVSCEQNNLTPINADVIRERLKELS